MKLPRLAAPNQLELSVPGKSFSGTCPSSSLIQWAMMRWFKAAWPLSLSALSLWCLAHLLPQMYWDFQFSRHGVAPVSAWFTDLSQDDDSFHYAYVVGDTVFAGKASWNDADSDIYGHKPGDSCVGVEYLAKTPWRSTYRRAANSELYWEKRYTGCALAIFVLGIWWSRIRFRRLQHTAFVVGHPLQGDPHVR